MDRPARISPESADQLAYPASDLAGLGQHREVVAQLLSHRPAEFTCPGRIVFVCLAELEIAAGSRMFPEFFNDGLEVGQ